MQDYNVYCNYCKNVSLIISENIQIHLDSEQNVNVKCTCVHIIMLFHVHRIKFHNFLVILCESN